MQAFVNSAVALLTGCNDTKNEYGDMIE